MKVAALNQNQNYQLGLLHFAHLLVMVDGYIDDREKIGITNLLREEQIPDDVYLNFQKFERLKSERELYERGVALLSACTEEEKLGAIVHLYRLSEIDGHVHVKEVRLILYSIKATRIEFEDVELAAKLLKAGSHLATA